MSREGSEQMLSLLKELAVFKAMVIKTTGPAPRVEWKQKPMGSASEGGRR
jgi:hypothetical protein